MGSNCPAAAVFIAETNRTLELISIRPSALGSEGNTGHATANTGNLLSVLTLHIIQVVMTEFGWSYTGPDGF